MSGEHGHGDGHGHGHGDGHGHGHGHGHGKPLVPLTRRGKEHEGRKHFLAVVSKEEAERVWRAALEPRALESESVPVGQALGRVLAEDVTAPLDLPPFDRAVVDGFAVIASDTFQADESKPVRLAVAGKAVAAGDRGSEAPVTAGKALEVATGAPLPEGANAVVMVENIERVRAAGAPPSPALPPLRGGREEASDQDEAILVARAVVPGEGIQKRGGDVRLGEVVFRKGDRLSARDTGVLAGIGMPSVRCVRRPRVAVISTGDELVPPNWGPLARGEIYDANGRIVSDIIRENGCEAVELGIARDREDELTAILDIARGHDAIVLSGGTSKGAGDLTYKLVDLGGKPGILVHGVAVKPGKPTVLAAWGKKPVAILPGFPSSAAVTFTIFVKPVLRILAGLDPDDTLARREATCAVTFPAGGGRHEYVLSHLVKKPGGELVAWPILKGSGSIAAFAQADCWLEVQASRDRANRGERFQVTLLRKDGLADLAVAGTPCPVLDRLLSLVRERSGFRAKVIPVGAKAGLEGVANGFADIAATNLPESEREAASLSLTHVSGYRRPGGERMDFAIPRDRLELAPVKAFLETLASVAFKTVCEGLAAL